MNWELHLLAAVDPSDVPLPAWVPEVMPPLGIALGVLLAAWLLLSLVRWLHRRAYNLTKAETARGKPDAPGFLKVDPEARQAALDRGDAYVRPADRADAGAAPDAGKGSAWPFLCRLGVILVAIAHFGVVAISVADATHNAEKVVADISAADRFTAIVSRYWLGIGLGAVVLTAEIVRFAVSRREKS